MWQSKGFLIIYIYVNFVVGLQITTLHFKCRVPTSEPSGLVLAWYYFDDMIHSEGSVGNRGRFMLINENLYNDSELSFSSFLNHVYTTQLSAAK